MNEARVGEKRVQDFGRETCRKGITWEDNIKMGRGGICWDGVDWINLAQDNNKWQDSLNAILKLRVS
jgi:hypothetical protein